MDIPFVNMLLILAGYINLVIAIGFSVYLFRRFNAFALTNFELAARVQIPCIIAEIESGEILFATPAIETMFGYYQGELLGESVDRLVPQVVRETHARHRAVYSAMPTARMMRGVDGVCKDGRIIAVEVGLIPVAVNGQHCVMAIIYLKQQKDIAV